MTTTIPYLNNHVNKEGVNFFSRYGGRVLIKTHFGRLGSPFASATWLR